MDLPDPIDAIEFRMEQIGLDNKDLEPLIGGRGRVSEVLRGVRQLSIELIRRVHSELHIPAEVVLQRSKRRRTVGTASRPNRRPKARSAPGER